MEGSPIASGRCSASSICTSPRDALLVVPPTQPTVNRPRVLPQPPLPWCTQLLTLPGAPPSLGSWGPNPPLLLLLRYNLVLQRVAVISLPSMCPQGVRRAVNGMGRGSGNSLKAEGLVSKLADKVNCGVNFSELGDLTERITKINVTVIRVSKMMEVRVLGRLKEVDNWTTHAVVPLSVPEASFDNLLGAGVSLSTMTVTVAISSPRLVNLAPFVGSSHPSKCK